MQRLLPVALTLTHHRAEGEAVEPTPRLRLKKSAAPITRNGTKEVPTSKQERKAKEVRVEERQIQDAPLIGGVSAKPPSLDYPGWSKDIYTNEELRYTVTLDVGAMRWLWEIAEAEIKKAHNFRTGSPSTEAGMRAANTLRNSYWRAENPKVLEPPKKVLKFGSKKPEAQAAEARPRLKRKASV